MGNSFLAERFQKPMTGFALDTEALARYSDVIDLSIGDPDLITDERIINAAFADAKAGYTHYGEPKGDPELIAQVCKAWCEDYGQIITPKEVLVTASSCLGMSLALMAVLNPGDEVIVFTPYFPIYRQQIELAGGKCVEVPTYAAENFAIDGGRLRGAITERTRAIIFNNPCNPTGVAYSMADYEIIADAARTHHLLVLADEIYTAYLFEGRFVPFRTLPDMAACTVTLNSFSKNYLMTGWRVGTVIAPPEIVDAMDFINGTLVYSTPSISQRAALAALRQRKELLHECTAAFLERSAYAAERIRRIPYLDLVAPKGTFYLFPGIQKTGLTSQAFCDVLLERAHILVSPGQAFGQAGEGHFRISCTVGMETLKEAFDRMEKLF
ncbi:MAG: aminotransferase class I/II-fold pyridoxal phosphate-dependent enzyme [Clostridiales bacterium]|nr:aminotransferase class I/II-fold pyridoxal phosphate-dependent enzyme [Candidatus Cacconaster stercorequi]